MITAMIIAVLNVNALKNLLIAKKVNFRLMDWSEHMIVVLY